MTHDNYLDRLVTIQLVKKSDEEKALHVSSGKLSASILGNPLQWQILKIIGVPERPLDPYVLRKFQRGKDVEDQIVQWMKDHDCLVEAQKKIEYRNCVGFIDAMVDMKNWDSGLGVVPHEIKSVKNSAFKNIEGKGEAYEHHRLQATMYAMAVGSDYYAIDYIAADDLRILNFTYETKTTKASVDRVIDAFEAQMILKKIPLFKAKLFWQSLAEYNSYVDWMDLDETQIEERLRVEYPDAYKKLITKT